MDSSSRGSVYRPEVDGLRGIAVIAVVAFHADLGLAGGFVGVDVFFVISGFLITGLILAGQDRGTFRLREFWLRRIRRLFPAMAAMQIAVLLAGAALMLPSELAELSRSSIAQLLLHANHYFASELGYFAGPAAFKPLLHTWSLAVEEQFYLLLPPMLIAFSRLSRRALFRAMSALALLSFAASAWAVERYPTEAFYWLPFRAWELLLGGLLACAPAEAGRSSSRRTNEAVGALGLIGIATSVAAFDSLTPFPGPTAALPCASTVLAISGASDPRTVAHRILCLRPLVGVGLISYSLYLFHWPVISFMKLEWGEPLTTLQSVVAIGLSAGLGLASWKLVESPVRERRRLARPRRLVWTAAAGGLAMLAVAGVGWRSGGLPDRWEPELRGIYDFDLDEVMVYSTKQIDSIRADALPRIGGSNAAEPPAVLIWGDSHAAFLGRLVNSLANDLGLSGFVLSRGGRIPLLEAWRPGNREEATAWNAEMLEFVRRNRISNVLLVARWDIYVEGRANGRDDTLIKDRDSNEHSRRDSRRVLERGLDRTVDALQRLGVRVFVMKQVPLQREDPIRALVNATRRGDPPPPGVTLDQHRERQRHVNRILDALQDRQVAIVDPADYCFDGSGHSRIGERDASFYFDPSHLSPRGALHLLTPMLRDVFEQIALARARPTTVADAGARFPDPIGRRH